MKPPRSLKARALQWLAQREQSRAELQRKLLPHAVAEVAAEAANAAAAAAAGQVGVGDGAAGKAGAGAGAWAEAEAGAGAEAEAEAEARAGGEAGPGARIGAGIGLRIQAHAAAPRALGPAGWSSNAEAASLTPAARVEAVLDWLESHQYLSAARFVESRVHARAGRFGNLRIRQELKQHRLTLSPDAAQALRETELQRAASVRERKFANWPASTAERARQARFLAGRGFSPEVIGRVLRGALEPSDEAA